MHGWWKGGGDGEERDRAAVRDRLYRALPPKGRILVMNPDPLKNIRVVLSRPSHPGNIGAAARAMKTMGLSDLCW